MADDYDIERIDNLYYGLLTAFEIFVRSLAKRGLIPHEEIQTDLRKSLKDLKKEFAGRFRDDDGRYRAVLATHRSLIHALEPQSERYSAEDVHTGALDEEI